MRQLLFFFLFPFCFNAQTDAAFVIFNAKGKKVTIQQMIRKAISAELILFGEYHDNPIAHWLESSLTKELFLKNGKQLVLGFEMFEQDQQVILDSYLAGEITEKQFNASLRLWPNYETDYEPIILFAKENGIPCVASNVERKYASMLFKGGRTSLDTIAAIKKTQMAEIDFPIDTTLSQYVGLNEMGMHMGGGNMLEAQAFKDATMAKFILKKLTSGRQMIHFNGAYHSDFYQGILWYVQQSRPTINALTISTVSQKKVSKLEKEHLGKADFIICVIETMTKTH